MLWNDPRAVFFAALVLDRRVRSFQIIAHTVPRRILHLTAMDVFIQRNAEPLDQVGPVIAL